MADMKVTKEFHFDSAHMLPLHSGKCSRLHGHTYKLIVSIMSSKSLQNTTSSEGMLIDFGDLKQIVNTAVIDNWDHRFIARGDEWPYVSNRQPDQVHLVGVRTTVENLSMVAAKLIAERIKHYFVKLPAPVKVQVRLFEGINNSALSEVEIK